MRDESTITALKPVFGGLSHAMLLAVIFCVGLAPVLSHAEDEASEQALLEHQDFLIEAPQEFRGVWERPFAPFLNPIQTRNWVNVRIEKQDKVSGEVSGHFDYYVRSLCEDVVDAPFTGTFDGKMLHVEYKYQLCPGMKPLHLRLWKEEAGYRGRVAGWPFVINSVVTAQAK